MKRKTGSPVLFAAALTLLGAACSFSDDELSPVVAPLHAVFPGPAWGHVDADGFLRILPEGADLPGNLAGVPTDWRAEFELRDGWSPVQPILIPTNAAACPAMPQPGAEAWSVAATSPIHLYDPVRGETLPWFGEPGEDPSICEIYPLDLFADGARVEVLVGGALAPVVPASAWQDDGTLAAARAAGRGPQGLAVAWRFQVGTRLDRVRSMYLVADETVRWMRARSGNLLLDVERDPGENYPQAESDTIFAWKGHYRVPNWTGPDGQIHWDDDGRPVMWGETKAQFFLLAPRSVTLEADIPFVQYGHGLFGDAREVWYGSQRALRNRTAGVYAATTWGKAIRYFHRAIAALVDPNNLPLLRDIIIDAMGHQLVLSHLLKTELGDLVALELGRPVSDAVDYVGISQGGILGSALMAVSPDIRRGVLHVGGGGWTAMMTHSSNWERPDDPDGFTYGNVLAATIPDNRDRTYLQALWQVMWDEWDPAVFASFWHTPPAGIDGPRPPADRQVYYPYGIDDPQVPNFSSETVMREGGVPLLVPSITEPLGIATVTHAEGPFPAVADQWDVGGGEPAHGEVRRLPAFVEAVRGFIRTGIVPATCGAGPCVYAPDAGVSR